MMVHRESGVHCLLIHQAYAGPGDPGGTRHFEVARHLARLGHRFTVVTGTVNYLTGTPRDPDPSPGGGAPRSPRVVTAWVPATLHRSFAWRVLAFLAFSVTSCAAALRVGGVDVVLGTSPPIFQAATAWAVARLKRVPFVLEVRDLWPEFAIDMGVLQNPVLIRMARWLEQFLYARAGLIVVNSPAYKGYLMGKGVEAERIQVVPNGVDPSMFDPKADGSPGRDLLGVEPDAFVVVYAGALGMANDIPTILEAARLVGGEENVMFVFAGDGKERPALEKMAVEMGLKNVRFTGAFPKEKVPEILAAADACVATLMDIPMFRTTYPNKVFDYMAAGKPTILGIGGVIREVLEEAGGGICVPPGDSHALAEAIRSLAADWEAAGRMGASARRHVVQHFDRAVQAERFAEILGEVAGKKA